MISRQSEETSLAPRTALLTMTVFVNYKSFNVLNPSDSDLAILTVLFYAHLIL